MYLLEVSNPVAQQRGALETKDINKRPSTLEGKVVGLLWDGQGREYALKQVGELLKERFTDVHTKFYVGGHPTPPLVLEKAATECDVVVSGFAD